MTRDHDPLLEALELVHGQAYARINRVAAGEEGKRALDAVAAQLRSLAAAEASILYPAFSRVTLRPETRALLDDSRDHRDVQLAGIDELARTKRSHLRKLRALRLCALIESDAQRHAAQLIPVLRCQLPRVMYAAIGRAFAARVAEHAAADSPDVTVKRAG